MRSPNARAERIASLERASKPSTSAEGSDSRVSGGLRFGEHLREIRAALFDLGQDVVTGSVQNAIEGGDAVA